MLHKCICIFLWIIVFIFLINLYKKNNIKKSINEYYDTKSQFKKLKAANPGYGKVVSVDDEGNLNSFEFPKGIIVAWSGDISKIPDGWTICNGTNGAPDLRGSFILGANPNSNRNSDMMVNEMASKGGAEKHTLTIEEIPAHSHNFRVGGGSRNDGDGYGPKDGYPVSYGGGFGVKTYNSGGGSPHNNMPPYYTLAYIMKL